MKKQLLIFLGLSFFMVHSSIAQTKPWMTQLDLGLLGGKTKDVWEDKATTRMTLSFSAFHGKELIRNQTLGVYLGLDHYPSVTLVPIGVGWRGFLRKKAGPQFFSGLDLAYGSPLLEKVERTDWSSNWHEAGLMLRPSVGVKFPAKKGDWALTASVGYKRQATYYFDGGHSESGSKPKIPLVRTRSALPEGFSSLNSTSILYHSLSVQVGILF